MIEPEDLDRLRHKWRQHERTEDLIDALYPGPPALRLRWRHILAGIIAWAILIGAIALLWGWYIGPSLDEIAVHRAYGDFILH